MDDPQIVNALLELGWCALEAVRPSVLLKPKVYMDGDRWCALLGGDLQEGICGFGRSPDEACLAFDTAWYTCVDTTCGDSRCSKCKKAKAVEHVLEVQP